ncbi:alpha/beta fold hydrolase [SAR202 cluster bacterium AD-802-E10_MRT_200m]|nr:alpha/beta fold hydrolase [SAR202 cluster bacterium AD-802-E10_MRT_200m]
MECSRQVLTPYYHVQLWRKRNLKKLFRTRSIIIALLLLVVLYGAICIFVVNGVASRERWQSEEHPEDYGLPYKDVEFPSRGDGLQLKGWYIAGPDRKHTIIFVHGIGGDRGGSRALNIASGLWENEFNVLLYDQRASGLSEGEIVSGGYFEQDDLLGAYDYLREKGVESGNVGVVGFSMGAAVAILGAPQESGIQAVVADTTYASASELIEGEVALATTMPIWMVPVFSPGITLAADLMYDIELNEMVPEVAVAEIKYPVLLIHGTNDTRIPVEHSLRVYERAFQGSILWQAVGVEHMGAFSVYREEYMERVVRYFGQRFETIP